MFSIEPSEGLKLWRAIMQWLGGISIIVVAMFLRVARRWQ
jgi:Trk-type K+ transport system membrane component